MTSHKNNTSLITESESIHTEQNVPTNDDWLDSLTREDVISGQIPINDILHNSLYYPACGTDGFPIKECNLRRANLGIRSFIYADYLLGKEDWKENMKLYGYHILAVREFSPDEIILPERRLWLPGELKFGGKHRIFQNDWKDYAFWTVFERDDEKDSRHGPKRLSLLFVSREGVVTYSSLYLRKRMNPTVVAVICPGTGTGGNWTDFRERNKPLEKVARHGIRMPEYYLGYEWDPCGWDGYSLMDNYFYRYTGQQPTIGNENTQS